MEVSEEAVQNFTLSVCEDWVVLGFVCYFLAGVFMVTSVGRGRPRTRAQFVLGMSPETLSGLRASVLSKGRSLYSASFFLLGTAMHLAGILLPSESDPSFQFWGVVGLIFIAGLMMLLLGGHVDRVMRSHLRNQLKAHSFAFEEHIALTREIGELFGVEASQSQTLENYVGLVRDAIGIPDRPRIPGRLPRF
jgi:hypothetical protein